MIDSRLVKSIFSKKLPVYLIFFVTDECNARCNHCFYETNKNRSELTIREIEKLTKKTSLYHVNLTGGEPFLRDDLEYIAQAFYKNSKVRSIGIPTNGFNPELIANKTQLILKKCPGVDLQVGVSIDNIGKKHDEMRNLPGLFDNAVETVQTLKKINNLMTSVVITCSQENENEIVDVYSYVRDKLKPDMIDILLVRSTGTKQIPKVSMTNYRKLLNAWSKDVQSGYFKYNRFDKLMVARDMLSRKMISKSIKLHCLAGKLGGVIYEDGSIYPCELRHECFGNLRDHDYDFKKIWLSENADAIRSKIKGCSCTHECFQNLNVLFNLKSMPKLLIEWLKLQSSQ